MLVLNLFIVNSFVTCTIPRANLILARVAFGYDRCPKPFCNLTLPAIGQVQGSGATRQAF